MIRPSRLSVLVLLICCGKFAVAQTQAHCTAASTNVVFGTYTGSAIRVTANILINCNGNPEFAIALNSGTAPGAAVANRSMSGGGSNQLNYGLFSDAGYSQNWGNTPGTGWVTGTTNGTDRIFTVFAELPANQSQAGGAYTDTIVATISQIGGSNFDTIVPRFTVTALVGLGCSLSATDLAFGSYSGLLIDATSTIEVNCTSGTPWLDAGTAPGATVTNRSMTGPGSTLLNYRLLSDPARTINWGNIVGFNTLAERAQEWSSFLTSTGSFRQIKLPCSPEPIQTLLLPRSPFDMSPLL
jgi:spore coat protein U-like protein